MLIAIIGEATSGKKNLVDFLISELGDNKLLSKLYSKVL